MRPALLSILIICACGGSSAETDAPAQPAERNAVPMLPRADCAGPMAWKCRSMRGGGRTASRPRPVSEPPKKAVPDAVEAGPQVYTVVLENEQVRVLVASYQLGMKVPMHRHPDHVVFALTGGAAVFEKAGQHEVEVAGPTATRAIIVELGINSGSAVPAGDEPVATQRRIYKLLLDQPRVRVLDVTFGKGKSKPAALGDHVLLARDKGTLVWTRAAGVAQTLELAPGKVLFFPAGVYTAVNARKESFEVVLFELKAP